MLTRGTWLLGLCLLTGPMLGCSEDTAGEGEACETAQDCDGSLVCARTAADSEDKVCAAIEDTRELTNCMREYANMLCGLVLRDAPGDAGM